LCEAAATGWANIVPVDKVNTINRTNSPMLILFILIPPMIFSMAPLSENKRYAFRQNFYKKYFEKVGFFI
jgi:hypothetical protein